MGALHAWAVGCGLLGALITFFATGGDVGSVVIAGVVSWIGTYIVGPVVVAILGEG